MNLRKVENPALSQFSSNNVSESAETGDIPIYYTSIDSYIKFNMKLELINIIVVIITFIFSQDIPGQFLAAISETSINHAMLCFLQIPLVRYSGAFLIC